MPHFSFSNTKMEVVKDFSSSEIKALAQAVNCEENWFTFTNVASNTFTFGKESECVFVKIEWFLRPQEVKESVSKIIIDYFRENHKNSKVVVIFKSMQGEDYFEG